MSFEGISINAALYTILASVAVLVVVHFLVNKYSKMVVPSTLFWSQVEKTSRLAVFWGRFNYWRSFIFTLLILILLILILTKPTPVHFQPGMVWVIDARSIMADINPDSDMNILEKAKQICLDNIQNLPANTDVTIIAVGDVPTIVAGSSQGRSFALKAVNEITSSESVSVAAMEQALILADNIAAIDKACMVQVLSVSDNTALINKLGTVSQFRQYNPSSVVVDITRFSDNRRIKVYFSPDIPEPLRFLLDVSDKIEVVEHQQSADMLVIAGQMDSESARPAIIVVNTKQSSLYGEPIRFSDFFSRCLAGSDNESLTVDLFTGSGGVLTIDKPQGHVLLENASGGILAYIANMKNIYLTDALLAPDASFWKQRQFVPIMSAMMSLISDTEFYPAIKEVSPAQTGGELAVAKASLVDKVEYYQMLIFLALLLLLAEVYLYSRRKLV